jgi:hypothetical protein
VKTLLQAIATEEGFYVAGSRPQRNANPGDLEWGGEAKEFGATHGDPRFAVFPDSTTGWKALKRWLSIPAKFDASGSLVGGYLGATLEQAINRFAPPVENDTDGYLDTVVQNTGLASSSILTLEMLETPEAL